MPCRPTPGAVCITPPRSAASLPPLVEELTPREIEVAAAVARGFTNNAVGDLLGVSVETVKTHVGNAMDKLGARDRTQMAVTTMLYGLIDPLS